VTVDKIECEPSAVVIRARCCPAAAVCPACGTWSSRVHGGYVRQVRDLPLGGRPVLIHLGMRRFLCQNTACKKVTFAGQADGLTARYQRWSVPLAGLLSQVALELAGRAGTRVARALGVAVHRGTLLRLVIDLPEPAIASAPQVLGVDLSRARDYPDVLFACAWKSLLGWGVWTVLTFADRDNRAVAHNPLPAERCAPREEERWARSRGPGARGPWSCSRKGSGGSC
jgi:hypothetical protein